MLDTEYSNLIKKLGDLKQINRKNKQSKSEAETGVERLKFENQIKQQELEIEQLESEIENLKVKKRSSLDEISECCDIANFLSGDEREKLKSDTTKKYASTSEVRTIAVNKRPRVPSDAIVHLKPLYESMFNYIKGSTSNPTRNPTREVVVNACVMFSSGKYYVEASFKSEMTTNLSDFENKCENNGCEIHGCKTHGCKTHECTPHKCHPHKCKTHGCKIHECHPHKCNPHKCKHHKCNTPECNTPECKIRNNTFEKCFNLVSKEYHKKLKK